MWNQKSPTQVDEKELRRFAVTLFIALVILGGLLFWRRGNVALIPLGIGLVLLGTGLLRPLLLRLVYKAWMALALALGFITSHLVLAIVFCLVLTPIGLILRFLGKDPLERRFDPGAATYWKRREKKTTSKDQYEKMY
jgi:hypothetical protein